MIKYNIILNSNPRVVLTKYDVFWTMNLNNKIITSYGKFYDVSGLESCDIKSIK
jgi:hypothetical protein